MRPAPRSNETGIALITTLLVLMMVSALMVGFFATIAADQRASGIDRDQTQAYAAAHAGLEKMTSDLATLFADRRQPHRRADQCGGGQPADDSQLLVHRARRRHGVLADVYA